MVATFFNSWDFATPGSPIKATWISPLILMLSAWVYLVTPPAIIKTKAFFTYFIPYISGAIDADNFSKISFYVNCERKAWTFSIYDSVKAHSMYFFFYLVTLRPRMWESKYCSNLPPNPTRLVGRRMPWTRIMSPGAQLFMLEPRRYRVFEIGTSPGFNWSGVYWILTWIKLWLPLDTK